jgi:hypothetical protein
MLFDRSISNFQDAFAIGAGDALVKPLKTQRGCVGNLHLLNLRPYNRCLKASLQEVVFHARALFYKLKEVF